MRTQTTHQEFVFLNNRAALIPSLNQVLAYIEDRTGISTVKNYELYFKVKSITTELLTNSFKHSHAQTVNLVIDVDGNILTIKKYDNGLPVIFGPAGPNICCGKKQLSYDIMCRLYANYHDTYNVTFNVEECAADELPDIDNLTEHFGLLIITKCADEFSYHYDTENKMNYFTAKINLPFN